MTVTTNSPGGYAVTMHPAADVLFPALPGNPDRIPIGRLETRPNGTPGAYVPLVAGATVLVHTQDRPSTPAGDAVGSDYAVEVPFVRADTYSVVLDYVVTTR
jgi:hypothetical protein